MINKLDELTKDEIALAAFALGVRLQIMAGGDSDQIVQLVEKIASGDETVINSGAEIRAIQPQVTEANRAGWDFKHRAVAESIARTMGLKG